MRPGLKTLFGAAAAQVLSYIDQATPILLTHRYSFVSNSWFEQWIRSERFNILKANQIIASELLARLCLRPTRHVDSVAPIAG
jgi:hypothetical protein